MHHHSRLELTQRQPGSWAGSAGGEPIGWWLLRGRGPGEVELGYRLWRRGFAREGAHELVRHAFEDPGLSRVLAETTVVNTESRAAWPGRHFFRGGCRPYPRGMLTRQADHADVDALVDLAATLFTEDGGRRDAHVDPGWPRRAGRGYYEDAVGDPETLVLVADAGAVVGFLIGRLRARDPLRPAAVTAELESMAVEPSCRSRGVGRSLVERFHEWAATCGANGLSVTAYAENAGARSFYRALGYDDHQVVLHRPVHGHA